MASSKEKRNGHSRPSAVSRIEADPTHHLAGPFMPQTPFDSPLSSPVPGGRQIHEWAENRFKSRGLWNDIRTGRWVVVPSSSLKLLLIPILLHLNWIYITPFFMEHPPSSPFAPLIFISYPTSLSSSESDPRYHKGWLDLVFISYYVVFWSFVRQSITVYLCRPIARHYNIRKETKLDRFGEQGYAMLYFAFFGTWGALIMRMLPSWWYNTSAFWIEYPHWEMNPQLKCYYLLQAAYWLQQLIVLALKLEKPRTDYYELIAHHIVTLWLVGWSYGINLTLIGNAVYTSMDIPDAFLAFSKLLNYMRFERAKGVSFVVFLGVWTYFRHYLNIVMLWSVYSEFDLMPETSKRWAPPDGVWMVWWMKWQVFAPLLLLQALNLFWYHLMLRILVRAITSDVIDDVRSDDEDDDEDEASKKKNN